MGWLLTFTMKLTTIHCIEYALIGLLTIAAVEITSWAINTQIDRDNQRANWESKAYSETQRHRRTCSPH